MDYSQEYVDDYDDPFAEYEAFSNFQDFFEKGRPLNQKDYNLNSPLIGDEIDAFLTYIKTHSISARFVRNKKRWELYKEHVLYSHSMIQDHTVIHQWLGNHLLNMQQTQEYKTLVSRVNEMTRSADEILQPFLKGWKGESTSPTRKDPNLLQHTGLEYGSGFLGWHKVTLLMNSQTKLERENLITSEFQGLESVLESDDLWIGRIKDPCIGTWIITDNLVWSNKSGILLDKNTVMMIKDTLIGRIQTLLSLINREDKKFDDQTPKKLYNLYRLGDKMLKNKGDDAYEAIKMLEPMCNLQLSKLAHEYRPLIPDFPHFENHVRGTCSDLSQEHPEVLEILELVLSLKNVEEVLLFFGSFRHWGHPFIDYFEGLKKLNKQVTLQKEIDDEYANALASDLAYIVLKKEFDKKKHWAVNKEAMSEKHPFYQHVSEHTWPTPKQVDDFGDNWHKLPLIKVFEIPDVIDPSIIYSDKSHSMQKTEVLDSIMNHPNTPIPTRKVLSSLLEKPATDWPKFLESVDLNGLDEEDLVIGLKGKERELKKAGRFFSLMSWKLREYFVMTEYLIKHNFVPLFHGLTMADDMTQVMKKMLDRSQGQGENDYQRVSIANHIDYEKWNNHQRKESNGPTFRVMGQFLGYPSLIERTHEFFEKSLIYYNGRPDLMQVTGNQVINSTDKLVCWQGQKGGLEGLRQKGWSILNLLIIRRESKIRNTRVQTLAQGDNQVICTQYMLSPSRDEKELKEKLKHIAENNGVIMDAIERGTNKLGLIINNDETIQSADFLTYGKIPIFRGNIRCLEGKRWSRVTCVTNDQLPNLSNVLSSVSTNALTVSHFDISPLNAMRQYCFFGCFALKLVSMHNPALRGSHESRLGFDISTDSTIAATLFLDPSLGGASGMSLTRFLMRMFPDPVTEGLAFWKVVYNNTDVSWVKRLCAKAGHPKLAKGEMNNIGKLIENPSALNLKKETSAISIIKNEVKRFLYDKCIDFGNKVISAAIEETREEEPYLDNFLASIYPLFPRFLAEFKAASFLGITDSLVSLFQNSKTIRGVFKNKYAKEIELKVLTCEINLLKLIHDFEKTEIFPMWDCSSLHAKILRQESWGMPVHGATIPHPLEMLSLKDFHHKCEKMDYITVSIIEPLNKCLESKGRLPAYLGSKTSETTSIIQPWDRETNIPMIKRAAKLRSAISWFVNPGSNLAKSIMNNLEGLTGEKWDGALEGFKRTGSALHRFSSARVSSGGFSAQSPAKLTRMMSTTDTFRDIGTDNYDFMFQSLLIHSQITAGEVLGDSDATGTLHFHLDCKSCLSKIEEVVLESRVTYSPEDRSGLLNRWKPEGSAWSTERTRPEIQSTTIERLNKSSIHYNMGRAQGFIYGDQKMTGKGGDESSLFPLSIQYKVKADLFLKGLTDGLVYASSLATIHRRNFDHPTKFQATQYGTLEYLVEELTNHPPFLNLLRSGPLSEILRSVPHRVPPSYPLTNRDLGALARNYLRYMLQTLKQSHQRKDHDENPTIPADTMSPDATHPHAPAQKRARPAPKPKWTPKDTETPRQPRETASSTRANPDPKMHPPNKTIAADHEIRHASKTTQEKTSPKEEKPTRGKEPSGEATTPDAAASNEKQAVPPETAKQRKDPSTSGPRHLQTATGAHHKPRPIPDAKKITHRDSICGGDGPGGPTPCPSRQSPASRGLFNSLLEIKETDLRGSSPSPPSAVFHLGPESQRCCNLLSAWENPSDLSQALTWDYFRSEMTKNNLKVDLMTFDMEVRDVEMSEKIETMIEENLDLLSEKGTLIYKTYLSRFASVDVCAPERFSKYFSKAELISTQFTSSHSSEVYLVCTGKRRNPKNLKFVNWKMTWALAKVHKCWNDTETELKRAFELQQMDMYQGVPKKLISDWENDLLALTLGLRVESGIASVLCSFLSTHRRILSGTTLLAIWAHVALYQRRPGTSPPSIRHCQEIGIISIGFLYCLALARADVSLYSKMKMMTDNAFPLHYHKSRWNTVTGLNQTVRLDNKMASLGSVIRLFSRLGLQGDADWRKVDESCRLIVPQCTMKWVLAHTGLAGLTKGEWSLGEVTAQEEWEEREAAWTE
uniref:RNA-directed RNA polymerase L n=1 Tax=Infectious hemorrhagic syndrome virus TaxID=3079712 RepID=A0AA96T7J7_9RHAB|nr:RNA-dependent RNA polymerase [Infectious hemorrhagic syndrome virus]